MRIRGRPSDKLKSVAEISGIARQIRKSGKKIVFTNGCFDILHVGHVRYLKEAKSLGDALVVGLNTDASVRKLKGQGRPVTSQNERAEILGALESVDYVVFFGTPTPAPLIRRVKPDFLVKGGDWKPEAIAGSRFVAGYGGKVMSLKFVKDRSTTGVLKRIKKIL